MPSSGPSMLRRAVPTGCTLLNLAAGGTCLLLLARSDPASPSSDPALLAAGLILIGAGFDAVDGVLARAAGVASPFGRELDSLADIVTFGAAPAALAWFVGHALDASAPVTVLLGAAAALYLAAAAWRLARYNIRQGTASARTGRFGGLTAPGGGCLLASVAAYALEQGLPADSGVVLAVLLGVLAGCMVSDLPYVHASRLMRDRRLRWGSLLVIAAALLATRGDLIPTAVLLGLAYLLMGPIALLYSTVAR